MFDQEKLLEIKKEISTIIHKTYSSKIEAENKIAEIKQLIPEKEQAYKPSGKTSALALSFTTRCYSINADCHFNSIYNRQNIYVDFKYYLVVYRHDRH